MPAQRPAQETLHKSAPSSGALLADSVQRTALPPFNTLDIAVRAFAEPLVPRKPKNYHQKAEPSYWTLVFDTETTVDAAQRLRFGTYQVYKYDRLEFGGIFYVPDDPLALTPQDIATIKAYARTHKLQLRTVRDFVDNVFFEVGYRWRGNIVGFNLPFDISRLAISHEAARAVTFTPRDAPEVKITNRSMVGGFTFRMSKNTRLNVRIKHRSSKDAFFQFTSLIKGKRARRGFFVDVKTIAAALLGNAFSLKNLAKELDVPHQKLREDEHGGPVTDKYLDYAVRDTLATWECFRTLRDRYKSYHLTQTPLHTLHSEASVGKAYLKEMGIRPFMEVQPGFPRELLGAAMSSYFGGRSEVHIRRDVTRILYCDFLSMYPTVSTLMGMWSWVHAQRIVPKDATQEIQAILGRVTIADLQNPAFWPSLTAIVQIQPDGDILPVRAKYGVEDEQYRLALNYLTSKTPLWFTLADCIASALLTGRPPKVVKAWQFAPIGVQQNLKQIDIAGNPAYWVDPSSEDFYKRLIDLRRTIQAGEKQAKGEQASILKHEQLALKNVANATTYGIFIELNPEDAKQKSSGTCYSYGEAFPTELSKYELPGTYYHPLIGVFTTGAARLMLAIAERLAIEAGINWAFCDTDSMALAKPDVMAEEEFLVKAQAVRDWFTPLNPYTEKGPVFKIEDDNFRLKDGRPTKEIEPLYCYAISPKRYALFNLGADGKPIIRKALAHGLGHFYAPTKGDPIHKSVPKPVIPLHEMDIKAWQYNFWYRILEAGIAGRAVKPKIDDLPGFKRPAATRYGASTPNILAWCKGFNAGLRYGDQIKPFNFMLRFYAGLVPPPRRLEDDEAPRKGKLRQLRPIAPFDLDTRRAARLCRDRSTGEKIDYTYLSSYEDELAPYHIHPDSKFLKGQYDDTGFTYRRNVVAGNVHNIGKEADSLEPQLEHGIDPEAVIDYGIGLGGERITLTRVRSELQSANIQRLSVASGVSRRQLINVRDGKKTPKRITLKKVVLGLQRLETGTAAKRVEINQLSDWARTERDRIGLRKLARMLKTDHSTLAQVLDGTRPLSGALQHRLEAILSDRSVLITGNHLRAV
jgi:hypothetical protein